MAVSKPVKGEERLLAKGRMALWLCAVWLALCLPFACACGEAGVSRALLIGVDDFVSFPSAYPSSTNNVLSMQRLFQNAKTPFEAILVPPEPVTGADALTDLIRQAFQEAENADTSYLYLSTHGTYDPLTGEARLWLSDGKSEGSITPQQLQSAFDGIAGRKVLILDACNSGAFIGKGMSEQPETIAFLGDDFKVLTSSGALEESWYWSDGERTKQGGFYFTQALTEGLSAEAGYPADANRDGAVTLEELYTYLSLNHAASTPQVYPQRDETPVFRYDAGEAKERMGQQSPIINVTFSGSMLSRENKQIAVDFVATRPVRVAYQVVYQRNGRWQFDRAQLIYDGAERFTAFGDELGAISAGYKSRSINLSKAVGMAHGYVLVQLVSIDEDKWTVHAGRVLAIPPADGNIRLNASVDRTLTLSSRRELRIFIGHDAPCALSVSIVDAKGDVIHRICHRQTTRPMQITPEGSVFYWDGRLKDGSYAPAGSYRMRAQAFAGDSAVTVLSPIFTIEN